MKPLVKPNLSVVGHPLWCLAYVEQVFGVKNDPDPNAWIGWLHTKYKHTTSLPTVAVPVWFSWTGTVDGVKKNWGHVAVWVPGKGVYTAPLTSTGHLVYPSVGALEKAYGVTYVGWSEDIGSLRVCEPTPPVPKSAPKPTTVNHAVIAGDNLSKLASEYKTTVAQLVAWNKAKYPSIVKNPNLIQKGWFLRVK